ncbi:MAG: hypothetical protein ACFE8A_13410 [Candidatus Hodarchaeota archaeon]
MSSAWEDKLKAQLKEKEITPEGSKSSERSTKTENKRPEARATLQKQEKVKKFEVPDYNDIMSFAKKYMNEDIECEQFFRHGSTRYLYKQHYKKERGGGGWSGAVKATINILHKMKKRGAL